MEQRQLSSVYRSVAEANARLEQQSFANFKLHFSQEALADFEALRVREFDDYDDGRRKPVDYNNYGRLDLAAGELAQFLKLHGNAPDLTQRVVTNLDYMIKESLAAVQAETAWLTLRTCLPTTYFDRPRWHTDGRFYTPTEIPQRKIAITLKGSKTLLNHLHPSLREEFDRLQMSDNNRDTDRLISPGDSRAARRNMGTIFIVGTLDGRDAVHSEPPIHSERYFLSLLPGSREQIEELRNNWNEPVSDLALKLV
jgi:hypothetical protein